MINDDILIFDAAIILPNTSICKGGVCDFSGKYIEESKCAKGYLKLGEFYDFDMNDVETLDETVIFLGYHFNHWGHFLMDCLGKMYSVCEPFNVPSDCKYVFLTRNGCALEGNYLRFFELLGIKDKLIYISKPTKFRRVLIPRTVGLKESPEKYMRSIHKICRSVDFEEPSTIINDKYYLSRVNFNKKHKKEIGENFLQKQFSDNGFSVAYPEELSLDEQIRIFRSAKVIACINGTIPLNAIFGGNEKQELVVLNKTSICHTNLLDVCKAIEKKPIFIDVYYEPIKGHPKNLGDYPFWVILNSNLEDYFNAKGLSYHIPRYYRLWILLAYAQYLFLYLRSRVVFSMKHIAHKILK